jgi:RNA-directed DNA polymerase
MSGAKPFAISKQEVWKAYLQVKSHGGAAGVDAESIEAFEQDLKGNLYRLWNRMASGTYFPPPVLEVVIPKRDGGERKLGIPTVTDRIAQTVVKRYLEPQVEPSFHGDSYGYRPGKSAVDAVGRARERCWQYDWVVDLDIRASSTASITTSSCGRCGSIPTVGGSFSTWSGGSRPPSNGRMARWRHGRQGLRKGVW